MRSDGDVNRVLEAINIKLAAGVDVLHQVQRGQVARGVIQEHVLRAWVAGVDTRGGLAGVPAVDSGVELHSRVAAQPGGFGHFVEQVASAKFIGGLAVGNVLGPPIFVRFDSAHEIVGNANGVIGVLEEDGSVSCTVDGRVVAGTDQGVGLGLFLVLAFDEFNDIRMVHIEDDHLGGAASFAAALDDTREGVKALHEADRTRSDTAAGERFLAAAQCRKIRAGSGAPLEEHAFGTG